MTLSDSLKILRQKALFTQFDFAKELGVAVSTINRWEKGKSKPNIAAMKSIRKFCSINGFSYEEVEIKWLGADEVDVR
jgi:transcriptional regulator with XRE-family HTH domain